MGTVVSSIFSGGIQGIVDTAKGIIEEFHTSPEQKAAQLAQIAVAQQAAIDSARQYEEKLNDIAGQNIRADAQSSDKYTERARPTFMYLVMALLAWNYIGLSIVKIWVPTVGPAVLPADLLTLFGVCVTGYVFSRSADKALALSGETSVSVLGGAIRGTNKPTP